MKNPDRTIPKFKDEVQESAWFDRNKEVPVEQNLQSAMQDRTVDRGTAQKLLKDSRESKNFTIRMPSPTSNA
jgi:hypothetical protein